MKSAKSSQHAFVFIAWNHFAIRVQIYIREAATVIIFLIAQAQGIHHHEGSICTFVKINCYLEYSNYTLKPSAINTLLNKDAIRTKKYNSKIKNHQETNYFRHDFNNHVPFTH